MLKSEKSDSGYKSMLKFIILFFCFILALLKVCCLWQPTAVYAYSLLPQQAVSAVFAETGLLSPSFLLPVTILIFAIIILVFILRLYQKNKNISTEKARSLQMENELNELEERYRAIFENAPFSVVICSVPDGVIRYINPQAATLFDINRDYIVGKLTNEFYANPEERQNVLSAISRQGFLENYEIQFKTAGGKCFWSSVSAKTITFYNEPALFVGIIDITRRKKIEEDLQNQLRFEEMVADISAGFVNTPIERTDEAIHQALLITGEFFGADRSYVFKFKDEGKKMDNTHEWCAHGVEPQSDRIRDFPVSNLPWWEEKIRNLEYVHIPDIELLPDEMEEEKKEFQSQDIKSLLCIPMIGEGRLIGFLGLDAVKKKKNWTEKQISLLRVVTEIISSAVAQRNTFDALMDSEERFREIFENMEEVLLWSGDYFRMQYVSPAYEKVWGRRRKSLYDDPVGFVEAIYDEDKPAVFAAFEKHARGEPFSVEYRIEQPDGGIRWVWDRSFPVKDEEGRIIRQTGISIDITERKAMELELEASREAAEAASIAKSLFLANMSHEIRTPLNGVLGIIDLLSKTELSEEQTEYVNLLKLSADSLVNIINDILDISKIEAGSMELFPEDFDIHELVNSVVKLFEPILKKKGVEISCVVSSEVPRFLHGDSDKIRQILNNLLNNATKFTEQGKIELTADVEFDEKNKTTLKFSVKDTGIGIPPESFNGVFDPFVQVDNSIQRKYGGTGLGLSICKNLVNLMGGDINIKSKVGRGTEVCFTIELAKAKKPGKLAEEAAHKEVTVVAAQKKIHVLMVEDNEINKMLTCKTLEISGHTCRHAVNGKEAVDLFAREKFDMILMDVQMPEMDGYMATSRIREMEKQRGTYTPIVALTAHAMPGDREKCLEAGMDYYVAKPLYADKLITIINELFSKRADGEENMAPRRDNVLQETSLRGAVNPNDLYEKVGYDINIFSNMVHNFKKTSQGQLNEIEEALIEKDGEKVKSLAHNLKGSLTVLNEYNGKELAQKLENMAQNRKFSHAEKVMVELKDVINRAIKILEDFIQHKE